MWLMAPLQRVRTWPNQACGNGPLVPPALVGAWPAQLGPTARPAQLPPQSASKSSPLAAGKPTVDCGSWRWSGTARMRVYDRRMLDPRIRGRVKRLFEERIFDLARKSLQESCQPGSRAEATLESSRPSWAAEVGSARRRAGMALCSRPAGGAPPRRRPCTYICDPDSVRGSRVEGSCLTAANLEERAWTQERAQSRPARLALMPTAPAIPRNTVKA